MLPGFFHRVGHIGEEIQFLEGIQTTNVDGVVWGLKICQYTIDHDGLNDNMSKFINLGLRIDLHCLQCEKLGLGFVFFMLNLGFFLFLFGLLLLLVLLVLKFDQRPRLNLTKNNNGECLIIIILR